MRQRDDAPGRTYNRFHVRYEFDGFTLDTEARQLASGGRALHLSGKAFDLLCFLIEQRPRAINKRELHDRLWPSTFVGEAGLPVLIREIRAALGPASAAIRTVHRFGYAFGAEIAEAGAVEASPGSGPLHLLMYRQREFRLVAGDNIVGRDPAARVFIPSPSVSRHHAVISIDGRNAVVADMGSKNGTQIDGVRMTAPVLLQSGCVLRFGSVDAVYSLMVPNSRTETLITGE